MRPYRKAECRERTTAAWSLTSHSFYSCWYHSELVLVSPGFVRYTRRLEEEPDVGKTKANDIAIHQSESKEASSPPFPSPKQPHCGPATPRWNAATKAHPLDDGYGLVPRLMAACQKAARVPTWRSRGMACCCAHVNCFELLKMTLRKQLGPLRGGGTAIQRRRERLGYRMGISHWRDWGWSRAAIQGSEPSGQLAHYGARFVVWACSRFLYHVLSPDNAGTSQVRISRSS